MRPTSIDLRKRVVAARMEDGQSMGQIAERLKLMLWRGGLTSAIRRQELTRKTFSLWETSIFPFVTKKALFTRH